MALVLTLKVGNAISHVDDRDLPETEEEAKRRRRETDAICAEIHWAHERNRLAHPAEAN
jgi:hypothetical protein